MLNEADLKPQKNYLKNAIIGFVKGDTPNLKRMELYIETVWRFAQKPQTLAHDGGYFIFYLIQRKFVRKF